MSSGSFIRLFALGNVCSRIVYYLMNINASKRTIYLVRVSLFYVFICF